MTRNYWQSICKVLAVCAVFLLGGCDMVLMDPKGQVGLEQRQLIITAFLLMLIVVIPVIVMTFLFAWKFRASNKQAKYSPNWSHSNKVEFVVWAVPCLIILALAVITYRSTHNLDPMKPTNPDIPPMVVEVVALDWKWLFIYPEQGIATVNQMAMPLDVPVEFRVTSGSVMNSFFIPQLGSQIYAMAGMVNRLHLEANEAGTYSGMSANYSGHGFSGMRFDALAMSQQDFDGWVEQVRQSNEALDSNSYQNLAEPSERHPVEYFSMVQPNFFQGVVDRFHGRNVSMQAGAGE
ncbi:cytochrome ubiquinol oxidase subunit II [Halotalea alkalilenta]|uniref:Ubiquinol oxidase subunit 2 n=2 Tax=Halotalea alkalilenta TaxID=376489 RepID=A0A172YJK7_9GAMM|nr:cytochrome ubiquinol oxidase subunit II [Halotalea alkalilenta]